MKYLIGLLLVVTVVVYACKKEDQSIGLNILPGVKIIETRKFQDKQISAYTYTDDSIRVDRPRYSLLGSFNDPIFGYTNAAFSAQFRMPYNPNFESDVVLDSCILQMSYKYLYGDTITDQTLSVHELADSLKYDHQYLSTYNIRDHILPDILGTETITPAFRPSYTDTTAQIIRIRLNDDFGTRLLKMDPANLVTNSSFLKIFKGLYVEAAPLSRKGALLRVDAPSGVLVVHYHTAEHDSLGYAYKISNNSQDVSGFIHDYTSARFASHLNQQTGTDSLVYIQPTGGTKVKINIPSLSTWKDSTNYIINKATITFHVDTITSDIKRYEVPPQLYLKYIDDQGKEQFPLDAKISATYYGGIYNPISHTYEFSITQHLQAILKGLHNNGFYLVPVERATSPKRVVLKSGFSSEPIELNVLYTRYKQ